MHSSDVAYARSIALFFFLNWSLLFIAVYAADAVLGLPSMPPMRHYFVNVTCSMLDATTFTPTNKNKQTTKQNKLPSHAANCVEVSGPRHEPKERRVSNNVDLMCVFKLFARWAVGLQSVRPPCK